jgi:hypothetical protein
MSAEDHPRRNYKLDPEYISSSLDDIKLSMKELTDSVNSKQQNVDNRLQILESWRAGVDAVSVLESKRKENTDTNTVDTGLLLKIVLAILAIVASALGISGTGVFK